MVIRKLCLNINGEPRGIDVRFNLCDWGSMEIIKRAGIKNVTWLTEYDKANRCANVDLFAPIWYIDLASLREMIFAGGFYEEYIPELTHDDRRYEQVEKFIVDIADDHRTDYIRARHAILMEILGKRTYEPGMRDQMLRAAVMLEQQGVSFFSKD